jgi:hypothetical protein
MKFILLDLSCGCGRNIPEMESLEIADNLKHFIILYFITID